MAEVIQRPRVSDFSGDVCAKRSGGSSQAPDDVRGVRNMTSRGGARVSVQGTVECSAVC